MMHPLEVELINSWPSTSIDTFQSELREYEGGDLHVIHNNNSVKFYATKNGTTKVIEFDRKTGDLLGTWYEDA